MSNRSSPENTVTDPTMTAQSIHPTDEHRVTLLEEKLKNVYTFRNKWLALQALQASEIYFCNTPVPHNKRLAVLGDQLLDNLLCRQWWDTNTPAHGWAQRQARLVSNNNLASIGRHISLEECIIRPFGASQPIGRDNMATTIEAILAAVFLDAEAADKGKEMDALSRVARQLGLSFDAC